MTTDISTAAGTLQLVIDSIRDYAIFRVDPDGRVATWNYGAQLMRLLIWPN